MPEGEDIADEEAARLWDQYLAGAGPTSDAAFERLYRAFLPRTIRFFRSRLRDSERAEGVANAVFIRLLEAKPVLKSSFKGLVFRIARNICAAELATRPGRQVIPFNARGGTDAAPESDLEQRDVHAALAECLDRLPEPDRALVVLHHGEGLTYRQIADCLGRRVAFSTFTRRLKRIKEQLRRCLKEKNIL